MNPHPNTPAVAGEPPHADSHSHPHPHGLQHDLATLFARRRTMLWLAGAGASALGFPGCGGGGDSASATSSTASSTTSNATSTSTSTSSGSSSSTSVSSCTVIPEETAGPYPGDGSNASNSSVSNVLVQSGVVRQDIRSSFAGFSGTAAGVPLTLTLRLVNTGSACADLSGYAIYLWHCDRDGNYSLYSSGVTNQNYLRGVQATDSGGKATFTTIFPGCYSGRMPHLHFEVYRSTTTATSYSNKLKTSQIALPIDICNEIYNNATGYATSKTNFARISFASDNVFSDGYQTQLASVSGDLSGGYVATLVVGVAG